MGKRHLPQAAALSQKHCADGNCLTDVMLETVMCLVAGKLAHSLRLGPERRVGRYLRLQFSGHLTPEAQSGGCHRTAANAYMQLTSHHCCTSGH